MALRAAPHLLAGFGVDPAVVARRAGLDLATLAEPEERIPFSVLGRFLAECAAATRCQHFGLLLGAEQGLAALGLVGHLMGHSPDVGHALTNLTRYLHHQEAGGVATMTVERGVATIDYALELRGIEATDQICDAAMGIAVGLMRYLCGADWVPRSVSLLHPQPRDVAPYRRVFGAPVWFGAQRNAMSFPSRWLRHRIASADPVLRRLLEARISELEADVPAGLPGRVRGILRTLLLGGDASSDATARRLAISRRTLHRRLEAQGATFEQLRDELRFELAVDLLGHTAVTVTEVALALDYANLSAFTRAFRRWSGMPPTQWRERQRAPVR